MKKHIQEQIDELGKKVTDYREIMIVINNDIENRKFIPTDSQKTTINYIAKQARETIKEIVRLEKLLGFVLNDGE
jgi:hypothetical protein